MPATGYMSQLIISCRVPRPVQMSRCGVEHNPYAHKAIFCTIRDPVDRLLSELRWRAQECIRSNSEDSTCRHMDNDLNNVTHMRDDWDKNRFVHPEDFDGRELEFAAAVARFLGGFARQDVGTAVQKINGGMLHLQPQAWYVFDAEGRQTCDKVSPRPGVRWLILVKAGQLQRLTPSCAVLRVQILLYEDWEYGYHARSTSASESRVIESQARHSSPELRAKLRAAVEDVYAEDFEIHEELERLKLVTHNDIRQWTQHMIIKHGTPPKSDA